MLVIPPLSLFSRSQTPRVNSPPARYGSQEAFSASSDQAHPACPAARPQLFDVRRSVTAPRSPRAGTPSSEGTRPSACEGAGAGHPRGDGGPAPGLPAGADRALRARHRHLLQRGARDRRRREQRQAAQGPVLPRLLRHPRRRVRRGVPPLPDRPRDRRHPGLAGRHRRDRQPGPRPGQLQRLLLARASGSSRCSTPTRPGRARTSAGSASAPSTSSRTWSRRRASPSASSPPPHRPRRPSATGWSRPVSPAS